MQNVQRISIAKLMLCILAFIFHSFAWLLENDDAFHFSFSHSLARGRAHFRAGFHGQVENVISIHFIFCTLCYFLFQ